MQRRELLAGAGAAAILSRTARAADTIKIGSPMALSGVGALYGQPITRGAELAVKEINDQGGLLGRKLVFLPRDSKANADESVRVARELILKDNVDFIVGTFTSAESPAVSTIAKENKVLMVAPTAKTIQLTSPANLHPYIFRTASTTDIEGRTAATLVAKWDVKRVATIAPDYAYGRDIMEAFAVLLKKLRPDMEIVDQQWPKLGQADFAPFITAQLSKRPEAVFGAVFAGDFASLVKQAKPLGYFETIQNRYVGAGETGSIEITRSLGADYPVGIIANTYDPVIWPDGPEVHKKFMTAIRAYLKDDYGSSWAVMGYTGVAALAAGIRKANSIDADKVSKAMIGLTFETPIGPQTIRAKDHSADRGQFWGKLVKKPDYPFPVFETTQYTDPTPFMD
ncbi:MAG: ABC transporter substrate-binding protein [Acetobacteraceae bacterium]